MKITALSGHHMSPVSNFPKFIFVETLERSEVKVWKSSCGAGQHLHDQSSNATARKSAEACVSHFFNSFRRILSFRAQEFIDLRRRRAEQLERDSWSCTFPQLLSFLLPAQPTEPGYLSFDLIYYKVKMRIIFIQDGSILEEKNVSKLTVEEITAL